MRRLLFTISTLTGCLTPVFAQQDDDSSRGVARVSVIAGEVSVRRGDSGDNIAATLNAPLVAQDRLVTGPGSRAELQFDFANLVRLGANTEIRLAELQYRRFQMNLPVGLITFRVWQNSDAEVDINTPVASLRPMRRGEYRVQVLDDGSTEIAVRDGELDIFTPQGSRRLGEGRTLTIRKDANGETAFMTSGELPVDAWDQWNRSRDRELASSRSNRYLPQGVYGGEQLDAYGDWVYNAPYGYVWAPRVAAGWAPYRTGRWSWLDWYGWTWVSYDPWGWAPYHYGRWFNNAGRWCWWPGAVGARHFWSPALVSFIGFGRGGFNVGVGFGWGNVGWVPLAPFETYNRWWGRGFYGGRNINNVTVVNNINVTNIYRNARVDGGVSYVEATNFNRGVAYNGGAGVRAARVSDLSNASEFRGPVGIAPTRDSVGFSANDGVRGAGRFSTRDDQAFTARRQAAQIERVPFDQQQRNIEQMSRGSGQMRAEDGVRGAGGQSSDGWRRVGERSVDSAVQRENGVRGADTRMSDGFVQRDGGVRGGSIATDSNDGFRRIGGDRGVRGADTRSSEGFVQRDNGIRGDRSGRGADAQSSDGFVQRGGGVRGSEGNSGSGWTRFGNADVNPNSRGTNDGFVQRDNGVRGADQNGFNGSSRSRGVGAVDVSPRIVERGNDNGGYRGVNPQVDRSQPRNEGMSDPFGGGSRRGDSGWGDFGGVRGGGSSPRIEQSSPRSMPESGRGGFGGFGGFGGGGRGGGEASPRMSAPSGGGYGGRGGGESSPRMSSPSGGGYGGGYGGGGYGGGVRGGDSGGGARGGGGAAPSSGASGGGRGGRGGNQ